MQVMPDFCGREKNMGPAGVAAVIVRNDLMDSCMDITPELYNYKVNFEKGSMLNTPPTYTIYMLKLMLDWVKEMGGVAELQKINEKKAAMLYDYLDNSKLFKGRVAKKDRSMMNGNVRYWRYRHGKTLCCRSEGSGSCKPRQATGAWAVCAQALQCDQLRA